MTSENKRLTHCIKSRNFTLFPGVEILWKDTVFAWFRAIRPKLCRNCVFPQNFHTIKLDEITGFFAVAATVLRILTVSKDKLNLVLKRVTVLISSKTFFVYTAPAKRLKNQVRRMPLLNKSENPESLKKQPQ